MSAMYVLIKGYELGFFILCKNGIHPVLSQSSDRSQWISWEIQKWVGYAIGNDMFVIGDSHIPIGQSENRKIDPPQGQWYGTFQKVLQFIPKKK